MYSRACELTADTERNGNSPTPAARINSAHNDCRSPWWATDVHEA